LSGSTIGSPIGHAAETRRPAQGRRAGTSIADLRCRCHPEKNDNGVVERQRGNPGSGAQSTIGTRHAGPPPGHVPGVDGLRCLAILCVLLFHGGIFRAGWIGVWLFFVISGFVITRSLLASAAIGLPAKALLRQFYIKRSFRILPLYLGAIVVFALVIRTFSSDWREKLDHLPYLLSFTYNFYRVDIDSGYVSNDFFSHFWSLSVEEQFYLVFPALLIFLGVPRLRHLLPVGLIAIPIIRLLVSLAYGVMTPQPIDVDRALWRGNAVYQFGITQFDAFAIGALIALNEPRVRASRYVLPATASVAAAALAIYAAIYVPIFGDLAPAFQVNIGGHYAEVWLYSALDLAAATLLVAVLTEFRPLLWLCTRRSACHLGRISYGIYVLHLPIIGVLGKKAQPVLADILQRHGLAVLDTSLTWLALFAGLSVLLAHLSYVLYELPMMRIGRQLIGRQGKQHRPPTVRYGTPSPSG
jgi:peptidoglycan/LPS O-acetylase OafA/YrhL